MESYSTIFLEGGCYGVFGCSHHSDEWLEEKHSSILKELSTLPYKTISTLTERLSNGDIRLSYSITTSADTALLIGKLKEIIACGEKDSLYWKRVNPETEKEETRPPNYPHLVVSEQHIQKVYLPYLFQYSEIPTRRWSLS